ncbi:hypothetical protein [Sphingomonas sp. 37zxx]|uniref:hypothetical protein n=1 Tax=Sphingomonas sp. 37zxx TaxID=1550073 RepID=UPI00053BF103|nr:hypothetical protein [Sphingomonas sp. 37zxx]
MTIPRRFALAFTALLGSTAMPIETVRGDVPAKAAAAEVPAPVLADAEAASEPAKAVQAPKRAGPPLPPFAPQLSNRKPIIDSTGWKFDGQGTGWADLIAARPSNRQAARWAYATRQIALGRGAEAIGALEVMRQDEPDLVLVPAFELALGAAFTQLNRPSAAMAALTAEALQTNAEACAWRLLALAQGQLAAQALGQLRCALPALNTRNVAKRTPFLLAAAGAAAQLGRPELAEQLVAAMPSTDAAANLVRGRARIALGRRAEGRLLLAQALQTGDRSQKLDAEISLFEDAAVQKPLDGKAVARLREIEFVWRGGDVERRALQLSLKVAQQAGNVPQTLAAGAALFRYFNGGPDRAGLAIQLQETLGKLLAPENRMPLDQVAGLYWDYRDLSPAGADGDLLVIQFADRLQAAGVYERAAELLDHQLRTRARDIAQGPLSARVATLFILAGKPDRALSAIRDTEENGYPDDMLWARHRVEAIALDQLGRFNEALAVLQDVPDGGAISNELHWRRQNWEALVASGPAIGTPAAMTEVGQARILRQAVALAMLGRESDLGDLRVRYGAVFEKLPTAAAFAALTAAVGDVDPATLSAAMAAIPSASPAGDLADLIDAAPQGANTTMAAATGKP